MDPGPLSPEALRRRAAAAWLAGAQAELANARSLAAHPDEGTAPFASAFHAQQAVEKGIKALLVWYGVDFPPRHDLGLLLDLVPAGATIRLDDPPDDPEAPSHRWNPKEREKASGAVTVRPSPLARSANSHCSERE